MYDIARRAGVSRSTVSFILNERETNVRISAQTKQRILEAAQELGYRPNAMARVVATGHNPVLAFLSPFPMESWALLLAGMSEAAEAEGHFIKIFTAHYLPGWKGIDLATIDRCIELRLSGVVAHSLNETALNQVHQALAPYRIPMALLGNPFPLPWGISAHADYEKGCGLAAGHLHGLGHRRLAMVGGDRKQGVGRAFEEAFRGAVQSYGLALPSRYVQESNWKAKYAERAAHALLQPTHGTPRPTAICCISDEMAMVVMRTARRLGLRVPEDVSVVGWLNVRASECADPPLTTVAEPFEEMGRRIVQKLLARNAAHSAAQRAAGQKSDAAPLDDSPSREALPMQLVVRESTAPPAVA